MGLGSLVEFVPVMENDFHCDVFKEGDYSEDTNALHLTNSDSNAVDMLTGCFTDKKCGSMKNLKSLGKIVRKDGDGFSSSGFYGDIDFGGTEETERSLLQKHIPLDNSRLKVDPAEDPLIVRAISSAKQVTKEEINGTVGGKKGNELDVEHVFYDRDQEDLATVTDEDDSSKQTGTYNEGTRFGNSEVDNQKLRKKYRPLTISVLDSNRKTCSISGNDTHKGLLKKTVQSYQSLPYFGDEQKPSQAFSTSDNNLCLSSEQILNKTLNFFKIHSAGMSTHSSSLPSPASLKTSTCTSPSGKKEVAKRKTMQERLIRLPRLFTTCPQLEHAPAMHWAMLLRRFKKYYPVSEYISEEVIQHVLNEKQVCLQQNGEIQHEGLSGDLTAHLNFHSARAVRDPYATESSSDEDEILPGPSTSRDSRPHISKKSASYRHLKEQIEICAQDCRAAQIIEDCDQEIEATKQQLIGLRKKKCSVAFKPNEFFCDAGESSARCRPYNNHVRRKLIKFAGRDCCNDGAFAKSLDSRERVRGYALIDDRISPELSALRAVPLERRMQTYIKRRASRPLKFVQQRSDCPTWRSKINLTSLEAWEDQRIRKEIYDRNSEESSSRECSALRKARRNNHSSKSVSPLKRAGKRLVKRSLDHKRNGERYSSSRSRTRHLERRRDVHFLPRIFREFNGDDSTIQEVGLPGLPQKIDYKEICIPPWKYLPLDMSKRVLDEPCSHIAEGATPAEISRRHLPLELNERKRFQQYRDFVASKSAVVAGALLPESKVSKLSNMGNSSKLTGTGGLGGSSLAETASSVCSRAQSPTGPSSVDDEKHSSNIDALTLEYDRPSVATPYTPRHFPLSSPILPASP